MAINEMESKHSKCAELKKNYSKVRLDDISGFESAAEADEIVSLSDAKALFSDYEAFMKRNRINAETDAIYMEKIKNDDDRNKLKSKVKKKYTGWILLSKLSADKKKAAIDKSKPEDRVNGWDLLEFDEMNAACASCPLSWNKGKGCIGAFGPESSLLPEFAKKRKCTIIASALDSAKSKKKYTPEDAKKLITEVKTMRDALPEEGKVYVRRYEGSLDRMQAMAEVCVKEDIGFFFF